MVQQCHHHPLTLKAKEPSCGGYWIDCLSLAMSQGHCFGRWMVFSLWLCWYTVQSLHRGFAAVTLQSFANVSD